MSGIDWVSLGTYIFIATASGLAIFHGVAGYYHWRYYVSRRDEPEAWKCQPQRFLTDGLHRKAIIAGTLNLTLGGVLSGIFLYALANGLPTRLYYNVADYGWTYLILSTVFVWLVVDLMAYYIHRALHIKWIYQRVHRFHHRFVATTPYAAGALHPVELLSLQGTSFLMIFLVPMYPAAIVAILIYNLVFNIIDHSGVALTSRLPWQGPVRYHDDHHAHFHCNFGQHMMLWDKLHGTLRRQGRTYGKDVFGGKGAARDGGGTASVPPFVNY